MKGHSIPLTNLPPDQQAIRAKCFHPSGRFVEFPIEDVETSIPARFENIVELYPERIAIKENDIVVSYSKLNRMANRVANTLINEYGVNAEPVGLLFENGARLMVSILGVLKAGKFFVLLDPLFPPARNAAVLEDSQAKLLLADKQNAGSVAQLTDQRLRLIELESLEERGPNENLPISLSSQSLAYIAYTSGSSGEPKGVMSNHRNVLYDVMLRTNTYHISYRDKLSLIATASAHAVKNIFFALLNGATLLPFNVQKEGVIRLASWMSRERISICRVTIQLFREFCGTLTGKEKFDDLRLIQFAGDSRFTSDVKLWKKYFPSSCLLANGISSSETGYLTDYLIDYTTELDCGVMPAGYAIENKELLLLDDNGEELGFNQIGELAVRSSFLSPGYWQKPELTRIKFKVDPSGDGRRIFFTDDLGLFLPDGCVVYKGRKDFRVKIRGYNVETAEIEKALRQHKGVRQAAVIAWGSDERESYLVAYIVPQQPTLAVDDVMRFLKEKLAEYMIPSAFVFMDSLPLTNGKLDRKALPKPESQRPKLNTPYISPRNDIEERLVQIWQTALGVPGIGICDNFFDLGGHSLLAMRIASRVTHDFQVDLSTSVFFESSTIAAQADYIEGARHAGSKSTNNFIPVVSRQGQLPLSFGQNRLWFLNQLEPESPLYNRPRALRLIGFLDAEALEKTLNHIIARNEVLRTTIVLDDGTPMQRIADCRTIDLPVIDLRSYIAKDRDTEARRLINEIIRRPFDLSSDLLLRALLLRLDDQEHILLVVKHLIASDGWSSGVFWKEVRALYEAFTSGRSADLRELPVQYADYAIWQRKWLQGDVLETQLSYWRKQLDSLTTLQLPTDRPRPAIQSFQGARQTLVLSNDLSQALRALSRKEGVTLFMTLLAAFQTLLYHYTGQEDIAVGSLIAGRNRSEIEGLMGFFVNTLVLRTDVSGDLTFKELLERVRGVCLGAYAHQDLPFEKLVEELQPARRLDHNPLFQVMFQLNNGPRTLLELPAIKVEDLDLDGGVSKFDLSLSMADSGEAITGRLEYSVDLFEAATIERIMGHLGTLLEGIVANPEQRISELPILTEAETHQLLIEWNDTHRDYPKDRCIHELFEEQVARSPDAIAVVLEDQQLTYRELNTCANQLAHYLRRLGVGPESLVAICMERSIDMIVGLLGILKAGGAYVPLDPSYPKGRLEFMLKDSQASLVLTQERLVKDFPHQRPRVVCLDRDWEEIAKEKKENPHRKATADNLAYVIYTSGSTGAPKGALITHHNVTRLFEATKAWFHFDQNDIWTLFHSYAFDFSVWEIWGALLHGGKLIVVPFWISRSPDKFYDLLIKEKVTILNQTPSAFRQLIEAEPRSDAPPNLALRFVIFGGEDLNFQSLRPWFDRHGDQCPQLINMYGITETTVHVTYRPINIADLSTDAASLIGAPIPDLKLYILDQNRGLVPIGVPGELYVGGAGIGRGYLHQPELTAERFIANPISNGGGERFYRSGDLVKRLATGDIEYLGRIDHQVKIRGYRVELGEIEAVLAQHPAVREAVVLAREESPAGKRLAAYVVRNQGPAPAIHEFRSFLRQKLPDYMVPSAFVFLESLPLTPNGKVDRRALPAPEQSRPELDQTFSAPRTAVEELLAGIWAEVLKLEKVGIYDNFFESGGHSLLATQVISRVRESFQVELPLRSLFESPTVAGLAERIEETRRKEEGLQSPPFLPIPRDGDLPLSFAQQRLWFLGQLDPNSSVYNVPCAQRLKGPLDIGALEQSLNEVVRRHEALRTTFSIVEGQPVQRISPTLSLSLPVIDLSHWPERERQDEARRLINEEAQRPFDLSQGPLFRASILRLGEDDQVLLLTVHHIVEDGWSRGVLYRELSVLYQAFTQGKPSPLPDLPIQYADYAVWQREWLKGHELERQLSYWKKQLEGASGVLNLPTDRPRPAVQRFRGRRETIELSKELSEGLKELSRKQGVTLFMTLLAAFQALLYRYTGQEDIVVGSPIANRTRTEIEGLIGFFVNTLVLRSNFSSNPAFKELLARVREMALGAYAHQDLPFEKLVEELRPERNLNHTPLFQVFFNMVDHADSNLDLLGLTAERLSSSNSESKFDLTLYVREENDEIRFHLVYRVDLFSESWMTCFLQQYRHLLEQIVSAPEKLVRSYSLVTPESRVLLPDPSAVLSEQRQQLVTNTFVSWAKQTPAQSAVSQGEQSWTYEQLAERADTFARVLRASGLEPGDVVAVHGRRSFGLIAGMIGTLLSGGVLLLIDYNLPNQRKQLMLKEARARKILSIGDGGEDAWVNADYALDILSADPATGCAIDLESRVDLKTISLPEVSANDPAYIFFTSGTTGIPKAVLGCHKSLSHFLRWQRETFAIGPKDRIAQLTSLSFDAVLRDIFLPLTSGATLCLPELDDDPGSDDTISWLERERISVLHTVPSLAESWLASVVRPFFLSDMRWVFFVGEPLTDALVLQWRSTFQNAANIVNLYGPTETTLVKCFYRVPADMRSGVQPVGSPITETQALVLAHDNQLCGVNEPGEIVLRTPFRSLGYVNAPEESQKRFVKNPFRDDAEDLIYFTGDAGRYRPDGTLEILGRLDDQVKIRGVRVEPAEVTAILSQHPLVASCIVVGKKNEGDETCLVAYVVASKQGQATTTQLRSYLLEQLPAAMVPSVFVFLDSLPLSPNGKVDRKALPEPDHKRSEPEDSFVAPRTEIERIVAGIWTEVLKPERVGVHDNFFELGGHSLLASQIVSRIRVALQVEVSLRALFEKPTVASLCDHIEAIRWAGKENQRTSKDNFGETEEIVL